MTTLKPAKSAQFLTVIAASLRRMQSRFSRLDGNLVEQDIAARRILADIGWEFAKAVDRIESALEASGSNQRIDQWVKSTLRCDIRTMRRRKRLAKQWKAYEAKRRELGSCGQTGLLFALSLVTETKPVAMNGQALSVHAPTVTSRTAKITRVSVKAKVFIRDSRCEFITGDAMTELPRLKEKSVHAIVTSPPYWPLKRTYGGHGVGFEKTLAEYFENLVAIFSLAKRVLRDDGVRGAKVRAADQVYRVRPLT